MFEIAILIGLFSYSIFFLGVLGLLSKLYVVGDLLLFSLITLFFLKNIDFEQYGKIVKSFFNKLDKFSFVILALIFIQEIVNLVGSLGPETSFDALWYHLTIPKVFINTGKIFHISGGLLYYSDMPKLIEMLYVPALMFGNEIVAKIINFAFGAGVLIVIYFLCVKFTSGKFAFLSVLVFASNLVFDWQQTVAFVDLGRTFFEILALYYFFVFIETKNEKNLFIAAILIGFTISTKILGGLSLIVFIPLVLYVTRSVTKTVKYFLISIIIPFPWFAFSYLNTGNPFYPLFTKLNGLTLGFHFSNLVNFIHSPDPITPIYLLFIPLIFVVFKKLKAHEIFLLLYCVISFVVWFITPPTGGGRFIMAYLPAFSILTVVILNKLKSQLLSFYLISLIILISVSSIIYRTASNIKYVPVILGKESKSKFLTRNLNFEFGDFYDTDDYFKNHIRNSDRVLTFGIHNLYYVDVPFVDSTWYKQGDYFDYILVRGDLPSKFKTWRLVYQNNMTHVKLYSEK